MDCAGDLRDLGRGLRTLPIRRSKVEPGISKRTEFIAIAIDLNEEQPKHCCVNDY